MSGVLSVDLNGVGVPKSAIDELTCATMASHEADTEASFNERILPHPESWRYDEPKEFGRQDVLEKSTNFRDLNDLSWGSSASTQAPSDRALSRIIFAADVEEDTKAQSCTWRWDIPSSLGRPDGQLGGFYGLMQRTRELRAGILRKMLTKRMAHCESDSQAMHDALASLQSIPRPAGWTVGSDEDLHWLDADSMSVRLAYEKQELKRDLRFLEAGDRALLRDLSQQHAKRRFDVSTCQGESRLPAWDICIQSALKVMRAASAHACSGVAPHRAFRNFITDRDGTINNYCDRYMSSVQSLYNAMWVGTFARRCAENTLLITAAPLGGRQGSEGLVELCAMEPNMVKYAGSKGREYYDHAARKVVEIEPLPTETQELLDAVQRRVVSLCNQAGNSVFLGIGSGFQRKFGEITVARNDPTGSISDATSHRFMADVQKVLRDIDPEGVLLDMHDTGTDIEIYPRMADGRSSFNKGIGIRALDKQLGLRVSEGPNLVCGDTSSDVPMIETALSLMPETSAHTLAVLFVITPEQDKRTPTLAQKVRALCFERGAHCAILPSSDVLVAALALYAKEMDDIERTPMQ